MCLDARRQASQNAAASGQKNPSVIAVGLLGNDGRRQHLESGEVTTAKLADRVADVVGLA
jgi:hypothetical protein